MTRVVTALAGSLCFSVMLAHAAAPGALAAQRPTITLLPVGSGWLRGDTHVHDDHSADGSLERQIVSQGAPGNLSVAQQIQEGERSGLAYMPLTDHRTYDQHYDPEWESSSLLLVPGEEANGHPHAIVLGAVDTVVQGAAPPGSDPVRVLQQSLWDAHAQGAVWSTAHPDDGEVDGSQHPNSFASAVGVDTIATWNRASTPDLEVDYAETRWNRGYRTGVSGECDDHFKELWVGEIARPGRPTTSVYAPAATVRSILQNLWAGRTALDAGLPGSPSVTLTADLSDKQTYTGGDEVLAAAGVAGHLHIAVSNGAGTTVLVYKSPGRSAGPVASFTPTGVPLLPETFDVDFVAGSQPSWYRVELRGPADPPGVEISQLETPGGIAQFLQQSLLQNQLRALTAPIFVAPAPVEPQPEVAIPRDHGGDDGAHAVLGEVGGFSGFPAVASVDGVAHIVAEVHGEGSTAVYYRRVAGSGSASTLVDLSSGSSQARFPKVAARGRDVWVVWQDERGGEQPHRPAIYLRHSADGGETWQPEVLVRSIAGRAEHPDIAVAPGGSAGPLLVWQEISAGNPFDVMAQQWSVDAQPLNLSRPGKTFHAASADDTRSALYPASVWPVAAVAADGTAAVAWQDNRDDKDPLWTGGLSYGNGTDPDDWQIMAVSRKPGSAAWGASSSLGSHTQADRHPALAFTSSGRLVAAWDTKVLQSSGANLSVLAAWSEDQGHSWTAPSVVAQDPAAMSQWPRLGLDAAGNAMLVWFDSRSSDWRWRVMSAGLSNDRTDWSHGSLLDGAGINTWPAVSNGAIVFSSTRNAKRLQRDHTQQIFYLAGDAGSSPGSSSSGGSGSSSSSGGSSSGTSGGSSGGSGSGSSSSGGSSSGSGSSSGGSQPPQASLQASPVSGVAPLAVNFDASASSDPNGGSITRYAFDFGDGSSATQSTPKVGHSYRQPGAYSASVTVTDSEGGQAGRSVLISVQSAQSDYPLASLAVSTTNGAAPLDVNFDASGSHDGNGQITSYLFDFGDGSSKASQTTAIVSHSYVAAGTYQASVTVSNSFGNSASAYVPIQVTAAVTVTPSKAPVAELTLSPDSGPAPLTVTLDGGGSYDPDGQDRIASYTFDFGDGSAPVTQASPTINHLYVQAGTYQPSLTVVDSAGTHSAVAAVARARATGTMAGSSGPSSGGGSGGGAFGWTALLPLLLGAARRRGRRR